MIEQLKAYLSNNTCDYERDSKQEILLDEDRIQIYFSVDEEYDVVITGIELYDEEGNEIDFTDNEYLESGELIQEWVKPSDNTIVIEGRSYEG
jgi:hypothetical protein